MFLCGQKSDYIPKIKDKELKEMIMDDVYKHLIKKDILKCYLNDAKNTEYVLVLVNLPKDLMKLGENIRNKIEIMLKKPDNLITIEIEQNYCDKGKLKLKKLSNINKDTNIKDTIIKGFKLNLNNDNRLEIFGILNNNNLAPKLITDLKINNENHLTFNLIKKSFTPDKKIFSGTKEQKEINVVFEDENSLDSVKSCQTLSDTALFINYSFETVKDTVRCLFNKIGIIKNGEFFNCEHDSNSYVIYSAVDEKLAAKIKEEEKEKQRIYLFEQQRTKEIENKRLAFIEQQKVIEEKQRNEKANALEAIAVGTFAVGITGYGLWQIAKWSAATLAAPATGGASWSLAALTP